MKARPFIAAIVAAASLASAPALASPDSHAGHEAEARALTLDNGRKWATDEPLREQMGNIGRLVEYSTHLPRSDRTTVHYDAIAQSLEFYVARIVAECKLEPAADANLHVIVADLMAASEALRGGADPRGGQRKAIVALAQYQQHFDHPGFRVPH